MLKLQIENQNSEDIENEKILGALTLFVKNNMKIENLRITPKEKLKSGLYGDLEMDVNTMSLYNSLCDK